METRTKQNNRSGQLEENASVGQRKNIPRHEWKIQDRHRERIRDKVSMTVPDESMSIRTLVEKYVRGQRLDESLYRESSYDSGATLDSHDLSKIKGLDPTEKEEILTQVKRDVRKHEIEIEAQKQKAAKAKKEREDAEATARHEGSKPYEKQSAKGGTTAKQRYEEKEPESRNSPRQNLMDE